MLKKPVPVMVIADKLPHFFLEMNNFQTRKKMNNYVRLYFSALGETNEAFYRNIYTGQQLPYPQRQPLRPHRPAPSPDFRQQQYQHQQQNRSNNQTNIVAPDPRSISTAAITQSPM